MKPIEFTCRQTLPITGEEVAAQILDVERWKEFTGYGVLPGIRSAEFKLRTPGVVGSRIRVINTDGSTHIEEIAKWEPQRRIEIVMHEFSRPLSLLATRFEETWNFEPCESGTAVTRDFRIHPRNALTRIPLLLIAILLRKAISRHLREMSQEVRAGEG